MYIIKIFNLVFLFSAMLAIILELTACSSNNTLATWMADNQNSLGHKKLSEITIPGSHLSNAYGMTDNPHLVVCTGETQPENMSTNATLANLIKADKNSRQKEFINYLNTQSHDITSQLNNGIRYLELQICLQNAGYYTSNYYLTNSLDNIIKQIHHFIVKHPNELIIIDLDNNIRSDYGALTDNDINILHNYLQINFGSYLTPKLNWQNLTMNDMWATKHRIILLSTNSELTRYYDVWDKHTVVYKSERPTYTTIKKLTLIQKYTQPKIDESNINTVKFSILPIYTYFIPEVDSLNQLSNNPNDDLLFEYLYSLPATTNINIIIADSKYNRRLVEFAIYKNLVNKDN